MHMAGRQAVEVLGYTEFLSQWSTVLHTTCCICVCVCMCVCECVCLYLQAVVCVCIYGAVVRNGYCITSMHSAAVDMVCILCVCNGGYIVSILSSCAIGC